MNRSQFRLKSLSLDKGTVKYSAIVSIVAGSDTFEKEITAKETRFPHPDLTDKFEGFLRIAAVKAMGFNVAYDAIQSHDNLTEHEEECMKALRLVFEQVKDMAIENTRIVKITYNGQGDTSGIVLEGKYKPYLGKEVNFKTPSITLSASLYGIEDVLKEVTETIVDEAYEYIFEDKISQTEIDFSDED